MGILTLNSGLHHQCRSILLGCDELQDNNSLRAVFVTEGLRAYRYQVPEAHQKDIRVDLCLEFLLEKSWKGKSLLLLFLEELYLRYPDGDNRKTALDLLIQDIRVALDQHSLPSASPISLSATRASSPASHEKPSDDNRGQATSTLASADIGIIIALKEEFAELYNKIEKQHVLIRDAETNNYYYSFEHLGTALHNRYRCVAMFIGEMGAIKASLATDRFISKWNPQTIIMLGIAASLSDDASVGDVIVASQVDAYLENAKAVPAANQDGYTFKLSGEVYRSSADLLQSVRNFEFAHRKLFLAWQQQCKDELERLLSQDHLETSLASGLLCSHVKLIDGHVASGPAVGATRTFTDWLKERDRKYLALEMEAAGLMAAVYEHANPKKTMVIRAISDYGDERKTELDKKGEGIFRRYAIRNSIQLLLSFLDTGLFPQT